MNEEKKTAPEEEAPTAPGDDRPAPPGAPDAAADAPAPEVASPEGQIQKLEAELTELRDRNLRALADAENTRRRAQREVSDARKYGASGIVQDLLNVSDNLRRALESVPAEARDRDEQLKTLITGVEMVEKDLLAAFETHGIKKIEPLGEPFNHDFHQAMYEVENSDKPAGTVVEMLQPGYVMHDRLLRPAMVAVAKGKPETPPGGNGHVDTTA
ncbi:MAG: nucleotide exchange factor GrpE [Alphaproteobacteria bacterium]|nr:nucleotide exchange factor GrpE [Alphaproteobacteria bacterium]